MEQDKIEIKDYATAWQNTTPEKEMYQFGTRKYVKFAMFLSKANLTDEGWRYWIDKVGTTEPVEREFINYLIKYRVQARKAIVINSIMSNVKIENGDESN